MVKVIQKFPLLYYIIFWSLNYSIIPWIFLLLWGGRIIFIIYGFKKEILIFKCFYQWKIFCWYKYRKHFHNGSKNGFRTGGVPPAEYSSCSILALQAQKHWVQTQVLPKVINLYPYSLQLVIFFVVPGFLTQAYTLSHSTSPFLCWFFSR
jgi:hypothetical protein